jgi:Tfp pilus assembly protein PilN
MSKILDIKINLTPKDPFLESSVGKFLHWAIHIGRYIVIFTELIVVVSFAARFTLDRRITDLNDAIHQKETIVRSYGTLENNFRLTQEKIKNYQQIEQTNNLAEIFPKLQEVVPRDLQLTNLDISRTGISLEARAMSNSALNFFINNLQLSPYFFEINVDQITTEDDKTGGYDLSVSASTSLDMIHQAQQDKKQDKKQESGSSLDK